MELDYLSKSRVHRKSMEAIKIMCALVGYYLNDDG